MAPTVAKLADSENLPIRKVDVVGWSVTQLIAGQDSTWALA
jgi:hypothetical protein